MPSTSSAAAIVKLNFLSVAGSSRLILTLLFYLEHDDNWEQPPLLALDQKLAKLLDQSDFTQGCLLEQFFVSFRCSFFAGSPGPIGWGVFVDSLIQNVLATYSQDEPNRSHDQVE